MDGRIYILILILLVSFAFVAGMYVENKNNNITVIDDELDDKNEVVFEKIYTGNVFEIPNEIYDNVEFVQNGNILQYRLVDSNYTENTVLIQFKDFIFNDSIYMYYGKNEPAQDHDSWWNPHPMRRKITICENNTGIIDNFNDSGIWRII